MSHPWGYLEAEADHASYRHWLGEAPKETGCALHAHALMTNHAHLPLTPGIAETVSRLIISPGQRYARYLNTGYRRTGTLWDSRDKSSLIQAESYLLHCMRYIELNPVRAVMVEDPAHYRWTSYRANGLGQTNELITLPIAAPSDEAATRQKAYRDLFRAPLEPATRDDTTAYSRVGLGRLPMVPASSSTLPWR